MKSYHQQVLSAIPRSMYTGRLPPCGYAKYLWLFSVRWFPALRGDIESARNVVWRRAQDAFRRAVSKDKLNAQIEAAFDSRGAMRIQIEDICDPGRSSRIDKCRSFQIGETIAYRRIAGSFRSRGKRLHRQGSCEFPWCPEQRSHPPATAAMSHPDILAQPDI